MGALTRRRDRSPELRAGEWIVVRSKEEILATLDGRGRLDELPFQPEMFAFCGRRLRVFKVAHKTCRHDPQDGRPEDERHRAPRGRALRRLRRTAAARRAASFFWKTAWLAAGRGGASTQEPQAGAAHGAEDAVKRGVRLGGDSHDPVWSCQATALFEATEPSEVVGLPTIHTGCTTRNHSACT